MYTPDYYVHNGKTTYFNVDYNGFGRFYVPDLDICVGLCAFGYWDDYGDQAQWATDAADSAVYMYDWGNVPLIGDHYNQGFSAFYDAPIGLKAFIRRDGKTYVYEAYHSALGWRDECNCYDANGNLLWYGDEGDISIYTCQNGWWNIYVVRFHLIDIL